MAKRKNIRTRASRKRPAGPLARPATTPPARPAGVSVQSPEAREKCRQAAKMLEAGDFDGAEEILEALDPAKARDADALHLLGLAKVHKGRLQEGMSMVDRSILAAPEAGWMRVNRAAIWQGRGEHALAIEDLEQAVALTPGSSEGWTNLAASRSVVGDYAGAAVAAEKAARLNPSSTAAQLAYGNTLARSERFEDAIVAYRKALKLSPDQLNVRVALLQTLQKLGRDDEARRETESIAARLGARVAEEELEGPATAHVDKAVAAGVGAAMDANTILALALEAVGLYGQALEAAEAACRDAPADPYAWAALGIVHYRLEQPEDAEAPLLRALELRPEWPEIMGALGNVYWTALRTAEAVDILERAVERAPKMASLWATLGAARRDARDVAGAEAAYAEAVKLSPKSGGFGLSLALLQVRQRNFAEGYRNYERRWETDGFADQHRPHKQPLWMGEDLAGKKILVYAEQGVGDEVMYAGMLQQLVDMGAAVFLETNGRLATLFERSLPSVVIGRSQNPVAPIFTSDDFDFRLPGGALMARLAPTYDDLRPQGAYLKPDPNLVRTFRSRYRAPLDGRTPELVVGIAWRSGNPVNGRRRSAPLEHWGPVLRTPGVRFVNLQYGDCADELAAARDAHGVDIFHDDEVDTSSALDAFAAQLASLDLVVSIDNSTVHFAGALGVPTLMLLSYEPDWRWFGGDEGNPWYESVAQIRQATDGDWAAVTEAAGEAVRAVVAGGGMPAATDPLRPAMVNRGARPKALIVNDTVAWYHWGCTATSLAIREQVAAKGYDVAASPIRAIYAARPAPASVHDFDDDRFFAEFTVANPMLMRQAAEADRIVVNGEGTLHGLSDNVRALLYFSYAAARRLGKPVQIVNHSCYPEDAPRITDPVSNGLYKKVYERLEYAAFREHITHGLMTKLGVAGALAFDSLPLTAGRLRPDLPQTREKRLVMAGSASADEGTAAAFAEYARWAASRGWTVVLLGGARAFPALDETKFLQAVARAGMPAGTELVMAPTLERWLAEFARAGLVATGRFHHSIAAFSLGAPFVAAGSNTAKTHAILQLLERPAPLPIRDPALGAMLIQAHAAALDGQEDAAGHAARLEAVEALAMENYARL